MIQNEIGTRLKDARERAEMKLQQVAVKSGLGVSSISDFERGVRSPSLSQLQKLSQVYRVPIAEFFETDRQASSVVLWRSRPDAAAASELRSKFLELCGQFHNLERWNNDTKPASVPPVLPPTPINDLDAEIFATEVHKKLDLGNRPGQSLLRVLEEVCGIKVFHFDFPQNCAACTLDPKFGPAVLLNRQATRAQRCFDLAHELFHLITWSVFRHETSIGGGEEMVLAEDEEERFANHFARALLVPREALLVALRPHLSKNNKLTFDDLFDVARQFDIDVEVVIHRLGDVFSLPPTTISELVKRYEESARERHQAAIKMEDRDPIPDRPLRFRALAIKALHAGEISQGKLGEYLGISRRDVMKMVEQELQERSANEEVSLTPA